MKKLNCQLPLNQWFVTQTFGNIRPGDLTGKPHAGIDLRANFVKVYAPQDGRADTMQEPLAGRWIILNCADHIQFRFAHLSEYKKLGQVKRGDAIAISGNSGTNTTAAHLHLELLINGTRVDPSIHMIYKIKLKNQQAIDNQVLINVANSFKGFGFNILFDPQFEGEDIWAIMDCNASGSWADTKDTMHTPGYYNIGYSAKNLSEGSGRTPEDLICHEILHCLYEDAGLADIHDYGWGVANNLSVINFLKNRNMDYVILGKEQFLICAPLKLAFNLGDETELARIKDKLPPTPRVIESLDGYFIYPMIEKNRLKDLFGL